MSTNNQQESSPGSSGRYRRIAVRAIIPILFAGALWHIFTNVARFGTVTSASMNPTLQIGDYYILRVDSYKNGRAPAHGDIVVFERPDREIFAKRVMGVAGDEIGIGRGQVWLNGAWLDEPYLGEEKPVTERPMATSVPDGHVFVLGDNRNHSEDSRDYGPIPVDAIMGKVTKILWPASRVRGFGPALYE